MKNLTFTLLFLAFSLLATSQTFDEKTFTNVVKDIEKDPIGYLKANAAPDYMFTSNGQVSDLNGTIHRFELLNLVSWLVSDVKVRQYGTTAIATGTVKHSYTVKADGSPVVFSDLFTYTYAYKGGKWLFLGGQHSDPQMPPFTEQRLLDMNKRLIQDFAKFVSEEVSPEYSFIFADGAVVNYQSMKDAKLKVVEWNTHDLKIKQIGNVAIVRGINDHIIQSTTSNEISKYSVHFIYTFEYKKDKWLWLTASHIFNNPSKAEAEAAIKTVIEAETKAFHDGNTEGVRSYWRFTPQTRAVVTTIAGQTLYANNGDELRQFYTDLKPDNITFSNSNYNIKIHSGGNSAYVTYDETSNDAAGKVLNLAHGIKYMERVNGVWKVAGLSVHQYKP